MSENGLIKEVGCSITGAMCALPLPYCPAHSRINLSNHPRWLRDNLYHQPMFMKIDILRYNYS
jgi:hypothetical protein